MPELTFVSSLFIGSRGAESLQTDEKVSIVIGKIKGPWFAFFNVHAAPEVWRSGVKVVSTFTHKET